MFNFSTSSGLLSSNLPLFINYRVTIGHWVTGSKKSCEIRKLNKKPAPHITTPCAEDVDLKCSWCFRIVMNPLIQPCLKPKAADPAGNLGEIPWFGIGSWISSPRYLKVAQLGRSAHRTWPTLHSFLGAKPLHWMLASPKQIGVWKGVFPKINTLW
jgi:hypothetical protein